MESQEASENSPVGMRNAIREMLREETGSQRKKNRDALFNGRRVMDVDDFDGRKMTAADVKALALRLKKKGRRENHYKDLYMLQAALSFPEEEIGGAFVKVDGSIAALVRDLSGQDSSLQLRATYCCANLALAGSDVGLKVAKAAAPYLITNLQGMNQILLEASLWAIGSLAGSGLAAYTLFDVQGVYPQLVAIMRKHHTSTSAVSSLQENMPSKSQESRVIEAVLYAASHCVCAGLPDSIKSSEVEAMAVAATPLLTKVDSYSLARLVYLLFLLSCSESSESALLETRALQKMLLVLEEVVMVVTEENTRFNSNGFPIQVLTVIIRTFGNLCSTEEGSSKFESLAESLCLILNRIMDSLSNLPSHLLKETLWFAMQLLRKHSEWSNGILVVHECPWTSIAPSFNSSLELQSKRIALSSESEALTPLLQTFMI